MKNKQAGSAGHDVGGSALANAVVLIIRHAEKPDSGAGLSPAGQVRAQAYVKYFQNYQLDSARLQLDCLIAAADSAESCRPRLTLEPLSRATGLPIDTRFKDQDFQSLAESLETTKQGSQILICWHHGEIPMLLSAFGMDPKALLPDGRWPDEKFGWVLQLPFDDSGRVAGSKAKRVKENFGSDGTAASNS
jgi:hypothetical protein